MKRSFLAVLALISLSALAVTLWAQSPNAATQDFASVKMISNGTVVGSTHLVRNDNGITCVINTSGLVPGDVYRGHPRRGADSERRRRNRRW